MKAYVLVNARSGKAQDVVRKVQQVEGVKSANAWWGRPDIFALVEVQNEKALADTVLAKIQAVEGVESALPKGGSRLQCRAGR